MIVKNSLINNNFYKQPTINKPSVEKKWLKVLESIQRDNNTQNTIHLKNKEKEKLKMVSQQMEAIFVKMMYKSMQKNIPQGSFLNKNPAEEMFADLLLDERSILTSKNQSLGLARMIYDQYISLI